MYYYRPEYDLTLTDAEAARAITRKIGLPVTEATVADVRARYAAGAPRCSVLCDEPATVRYARQTPLGFADVVALFEVCAEHVPRGMTPGRPRPSWDEHPDVRHIPGVAAVTS